MRVLVRDASFTLSRHLLCSSSKQLAHLVDSQRSEGGDVRVDAEPASFQSLLDILADPRRLSGFFPRSTSQLSSVENIDAVASLAEELQFVQVFECCERFVAEEVCSRGEGGEIFSCLPSLSCMRFVSPNNSR